MGNLLAGILKNLNRGWLKTMLTGAGVTLGTTGVSLVAFGKVVDTFRDSVTGMPPMALAFAHMAGIDVAMSIILGAYVAKLTVGNSKLALKKLK